MTFRLFFFLLLLANLIFFAWVQGYLGTADDGHEPQRVAQQLHADKLRVVRDVQASAASSEKTNCRAVSGLSVADAETLKTAVEAAGGEAKVLSQAEPTLYLTVIAGFADKPAADRKIAELTRLGVKESSAAALENGRYEIILGNFQTEAAAREFLQGLEKRGIKSGRVENREQPALKARVEARAAAPALLEGLPALIAPYAGATLGECAP